MTTTTMTSTPSTYFARNVAWLKPAMAAGLLAGTEAIAASLGGAAFLPAWLVLGGLLLCTALIAYGATQTDTLSATVICRVASAITTAGVVIACIKAIS